jgi:hypothetical protein
VCDNRDLRFSPVGTAGSYPNAIPEHFQSSLRDLSMVNPNPGLSSWAKFSRPCGTEFGNFKDDAYSARSVIDGSTWAARQAGNQHAIAETTASSAITEM